MFVGSERRERFYSNATFSQENSVELRAFSEQSDVSLVIKRKRCGWVSMDI